MLTNAPVQLWKPTTNHLVSFYYSSDNEKLILSLRNKDNSYQISSYHPPTGTFEVLNQVNLPDVGRVNWINRGKGYAFQVADHWGDSLYVSSEGGPSLTQAFSEGDVIEFRDSQAGVFVLGSEGIEPSGIWKYDFRTHDFRSVVRSTERPFSFAKTIAHSSVVITNGNREMMCQLWRPQNLSAGHKYPLILSQSPYRWSPYPNMAACAGYYFLAINRQSWEEGIATWESDVLAAYDILSKDPQIDLSRVFLFGHSAETYPISNLAAEKPGLWKGILVQSPTELPDLSRTHLNSTLINAGEFDAGQRERLPTYQTEAAKQGVPVRVTVHPKARHTSWSRTTELEKVEELANFLSRN